MGWGCPKWCLICYAEGPLLILLNFNLIIFDASALLFINGQCKKEKLDDIPTLRFLIGAR